jgi:DTW domain-containing protein YfiP
VLSLLPPDKVVPLRRNRSVDTGVKFVFLMHPKEAYKQKTGTGRLTALSLKDAEIIIGIDFTDNARLNELISGANGTFAPDGSAGYGEGAQYFPVVLYPSKDAYFTDSPEFRGAIGGKKLLVIVVDATWFFARKMVFLSKNLHTLPKLSFRKEYRLTSNSRSNPKKRIFRQSSQRTTSPKN